MDIKRFNRERRIGRNDNMVKCNTCEETENSVRVSTVLAAGGRIEIACDQCNTTSYVEVKVGKKPTGTYRNAAWLKKEYVKNGQTMQEIADLFGVTPMTINLWVRKHGIESRPRGQRKTV